MNTRPKWLTRIIATLCMALTGTAGYIAGIMRQNSGLVLPVQQRVPFECYLNERSFSEIENTKSTLEALCQQFLAEVEARHDASVLGASGKAYLANPLYRTDVPGAIQELQEGMAQFKGTDQQLVVARELLGLLKREKLYDRWLDLYLAALYEHPRHELIGSRAADAERISRTVGREYELANAIDFLRHSPAGLSAQEQLPGPVGEQTIAAVQSPDSALAVGCK